MKNLTYTIIGWVGNIVGFILLYFEKINNYATLIPVIPFSIALIFFWLTYKKNNYV